MFQERYEEQNREIAEPKQKDEKLQDGSQRQKVDRAGSRSNDSVGISGVPSSNDQSLVTVVQSNQSSSSKCVRKRHLKTESAYFELKIMQIKNYVS